MDSLQYPYRNLRSGIGKRNKVNLLKLRYLS